MHPGLGSILLYQFSNNQSYLRATENEFILDFRAFIIPRADVLSAINTSPWGPCPACAFLPLTHSLVLIPPSSHRSWMTTQKVSHCCRVGNAGSPPNSWDWILGQQQIISCFQNSEKRAVEQDLTQEWIQKLLQAGGGKWVITGHQRWGTPCSWTPPQPTMPPRGAKCPGKQNGKLHS